MIFKNASLSAGLAVLALAMTFAGRARADAYLPPMGGNGGSQYIAKCPEGQNLTGFELRAGLAVDAIRPACVIAYGPSEVTAPALTTDSGLVAPPGSLGALFQQVAPGWYGGPGGGIQRVLCPATEPIVIGMDVESEGYDEETINNIHLFCGKAVAAQAAAGNPSAVFNAPYWGPYRETRRGESQRCPPGQVAVGVHGRAGKYLDAAGLICDEPRIAPPPPGVVKAQGRVRLGGAPTGPPISICESARQARARNSPAAPGLEAKCLAAGAAGETPTVKAQGRVKLDPTGTAPNPPRAICDLARQARERNSPAAPGLAEKCRVDLAAKGAAIAQMDESDEILLAARTAEAGEPYRQGFDIATAIFGNPALGAQGNTATGPGSLGIRGSLTTEAGQRGFDASVKLHLSRTY